MSSRPGVNCDDENVFKRRDIVLLCSERDVRGLDKESGVMIPM